MKLSKKKENELKEYLEEIADKNKKIKEKIQTEAFHNEWEGYHLPDPLVIVKQFIMEKGLKLYGGLALNELLKKHKAEFYSEDEIPDYDVFSPDAWNHAKELTNLLHKMGYPFVEARSSILNSEHHSTYKVAVDSVYVLDLTQIGCIYDDYLNNDCEKCGKDEFGNCMLLFDHIPAVDINSKSKKIKIYRETFDYNIQKPIYPTKLFVCAPDWLKSSMYLELTKPLENPDRLVKVGLRSEIFNNYFKFNKEQCIKDNTKINNKPELDWLPQIITYIVNYTKKENLIHYGVNAHNIYINEVKKKGLKKIPVTELKLYSINNDYHVNRLLPLLEKKFPFLQFKINNKFLYWRDHNDNDMTISVTNINEEFIKSVDLVTFTDQDNCLPYIELNDIRYAPIDRLKHLYYRALSIPDFYQKVEQDYLDYNCLLADLLEAEEYFIRKSKSKKSKKNKRTLLNNSKFRRYITQCQGEEISKIQTSLTDRGFNRLVKLKTKKRSRLDKYVKEPYRPAEINLQNNNSLG